MSGFNRMYRRISEKLQLPESATGVSAREVQLQHHNDFEYKRRAEMDISDALLPTGSS